MKLLQNTVVIIVLAFLFQQFLPWWIIAPLSFIIGYALHNNGWQAFLSAFSGVFLLWAGYAFIIDRGNEQILSSRIAELFQLPNPTLLILITGLIGGLVAGLSALSGRLIKNIM